MPTLEYPLASSWSQARNAWQQRQLLAPSQLARAATLPYHWYVRRDGSAPRPLFIAWYITLDCPQRCTFCNVTQAARVWHSAMGDDEENRFIDRFVPAVGTVAISGGEPLAHRGIEDRIGRIGSNGGRTLLFTSGVTLSRARAGDLASAAPDWVFFSVLGDEQTHDREIGRPGAWTRTIDGLENLMSRRKPGKTRVGINCVAGIGNALALRAVVDLGLRFGVDAVRFTWLSFLTASEKLREPHDVTYLVLPDEDPTSFDPSLLIASSLALEREYPGLVQFHPRLSPAERRGWFRVGGGVRRRCMSLWHTLFVRPDGAVVPCGHLFDDPVGNVRTDGLDALWNSPRLRSFRRAQWADPFPVCRRCCKV